VLNISVIFGGKHIVLGEDLHLEVLAPESTGKFLTSFELI